MKAPDLIRYVLRGNAGNEQDNDDLELGDELVIVSRGVVSKKSERTNGNNQVVCDAYITASVAVVIDGELPAGLRKKLNDAEADRITGADRLDF